MKTWQTLLTTVVVGIGISTNAEARRSKREGLNFGTSVRVVSDSDSNFAGDESRKDRHVEGNTQAVNPHVGYVFGDYLNLGLAMTFENSELKETEKNVDTGVTSSRTKDTSLKGGSIFARFLFAKVMFFEAGFGLYDRRTSVNNEDTSGTSSGSFNGTREVYQERGVGPGYHAGAGIEIPVTNGFYFTSAYMTRIFQLRDYEGKDDLGSKRARIQRREISFGLSHYVE